MSINLLLIASIAVVSVIAFGNKKLFNNLVFSPYIIVRQKEWYRFLTSAWLHGDMMHMFVNLYVLFSFGNYLENTCEAWFGNLGSLYYLFLFIGAVIIGHIPSYAKHRDDYDFASVGASGGVSGVLFAVILIDPLMELRLFFALPINSLLFGVLYLGYTYYMSKRGNDHINHDAHLWGALGGMLLLIAFQPSVVVSFFGQIAGVLGM